MKTLEHFKTFCDEMTSSASRKHKQEVLTKYKDDEVVKKYLKINFDPYTVFGISTKKLTKRVRPTEWYQAATVFELFDYLTTHNTGRDEDIAACQEMLFVASEVDPALEFLLEELICKDLSIGADAKLVNQIMPNLINHFDVMLAQKYFDNPNKISGKEFAVTEKIDGGRIVAIKENSKVTFYTRAGQLYEGLIDLEKEMLEKFPDCVLDGEITILNNKSMPSKLAYKQAMKLTRSKGPKTGLKMLVFDYLTVDEFRDQKCTHTWSERREAIVEIFDSITADYFELLPLLYRGTDTSVIPKLLNQAIANLQEGIMLSICDAKYEFTRTWALQKVKQMNDIDLVVIDFEEGSGRLTNTLGALLVRYKNNSVVRVGSGFTDEQRKEIWENRQKYLGVICTVQYFETTVATTGACAGQESLRFPVFCDWRFDKTEADF